MLLESGTVPSVPVPPLKRQPSPAVLKEGTPFTSFRIDDPLETEEAAERMRMLAGEKHGGRAGSSKACYLNYFTDEDLIGPYLYGNTFGDGTKPLRGFSVRSLTQLFLRWFDVFILRFCFGSFPVRDGHLDR